MDWQPIETAPLDGREALVYRPLAHKTHDPKITIARLIETDNACWLTTVPPGQKPCNPTDRYCHVTHWLPLPEEPQ